MTRFALLWFASLLLCFRLLCFALLCFALLCFAQGNMWHALLCFDLLRFCFAFVCFALLWQPWLSKHVLESHAGTYWTRRRYSACRTGDRKQTKFYTIRIRWLFQRVQQVTTLICRFEFQTPQWSINRSNASNQWIESMNRSKESKQWIEPMNRINEHSH